MYYGVYDRLTQYDINHTVQPMLAECWDISADFTSITFNLGKGVQFHNGAELDSVQRGLESPSTLPWPKTSPAYDDAKANAYQFDLDKASAMLKAAGVTGPVSGDVIMQNSSAELTSFAQVLQSDFATLGITLNLKPQDLASYLEIVNNWKYQGFWLGGGSFAQLDPGTAFTKSRALSVTGNSSAFTAPANAAAVDLVGRATTEADPARRKQLYSDLNDMLLDEAYIMVLSPLTSRLMATSKVQGLAATLHSAQKWWEAWLA